MQTSSYGNCEVSPLSLGQSAAHLHSGVQYGLLCNLHVAHRLPEKDAETVSSGEQAHQQETRQNPAGRHH